MNSPPTSHTEASSRASSPDPPPPESTLPVRVIARWDNGRFYAAQIVAPTSHSGKFKVDFDDGDQKEVRLRNMRRCRLQEGDRIQLKPKDGEEKGEKFRIGRDWRMATDLGKGTELKAFRKGDPAPTTLKLADICIRSSTVNKYFNRRRLSKEDIVV